MAFKLDAKIPAGALAEKWSNHKAAIKVVSPANKRKLDIIIVGTGLGGASAAASLGELGYNVKIFCIQDSPRRAHSIAAQGGINAAKNYQNDNDSVYRLFYDTIKGGDYRAREANVYRLAEVSNLIIDQCVAQDDEAQYEHVFRSPFDARFHDRYGVALRTACLAVFERQDDGVDEVDDHACRQYERTGQRVPVGPQQCADHVVSLGRDDRHNVHGHVEEDKEHEEAPRHAHHQLLAERGIR